jgi:phenol hydroxylase P1 protein
MLLQFQTDWFTETTKWIDATVKTMTGESAANAELVSGWFATWEARAAEALEPVAALALPDAAAAVAAVRSDLAARAAGLGITTNVSA